MTGVKYDKFSQVYMAHPEKCELFVCRLRIIAEPEVATVSQPGYPYPRFELSWIMVLNKTA
jgi:hypothetical protein